jgi:AraC-like DNA-binding protein
MLVGRDTFRGLCRARDVLSEVHETPMTIEDVAKAAASSPSHFTRQFEAVFGLTPHQFRIGRRLDRARQLLAGGGHSVTEVCMEVGFSSLGSFSTLFTKRIGETPSAYRRRMRVLVQVPGNFAAELTPGCLGWIARLPPDAFPSFREA